MIKNIPGTELVTLTTNGLLLGEQLEALLSAGLDAVNISLDTLDIKKYEWITGFDKLAVVLSSIEKAVASGIPVKINAVLQKGMNEEEWLPLTELARKLPLSVRFIEMMPIGYGNMSESISNEELKETIRKHYGNLTEDFRVYGNGPAVYYSIEGFQGNVGFISAMHGKFCNLLISKNLFHRNPFSSVWHTVTTAKITAVCNGNTHIIYLSAIAVFYPCFYHYKNFLLLSICFWHIFKFKKCHDNCNNCC